MAVLQKCITRKQPEQAFVLWEKGHSANRLRCDLCNKQLDWDPFPVIDWPSDEQLADPEYTPIGSTALCQTCALKFYRLKPTDTGKVQCLWVCHDIAT